MTIKLLEWILPYARRIHPYRTDSIDEFVNKVKEYHGKTIVAQIGHTSKVTSKTKARWEVNNHFSARIISTTEYGRPVIFKKEYGWDGNRAIGNIAYALNKTSKIPNISTLVKNHEGKEIQPYQYTMIRSHPEEMTTSSEQVALIRAYLEDDS